MRLGTASQIAIGTKDMDASTIIYNKIGFRRIGEGSVPHHFIQYTDDSSLIVLNQDGMEYIGLVYFRKEMDEVVHFLKSIGTEFSHSTNDERGRFFQGIFTTPDGVMINLVNFDASNMFQPGKTLIQLSQGDMQNISEYPNRKIGVFGEFSVPVKDLTASLNYWKQLGFDALSINEQPYPWSIVTDGINLIGLHQTTEFNRQAITYFAPDMKRRIENLKNDGLEDNIDGFTGTGGAENNAVLTTMENQKFFLFSF